MIALICLIWVGMRLSAPIWFYILIASAAMFKVLSAGMALEKSSNESSNEEDDK